MSFVIDFETLLANITLKPVDANSLTAYTVKKMRESFPFLDWVAFFADAFDRLAGEKLDEDALLKTEVLVQEDFLIGANELITHYRANPQGEEILVDYMIWRLLAAFYPDRPPDESQRKERCLKEAEEMFAPAVTAMYIKAKGIAQSEKVVGQAIYIK